jgi:predicted house-cleaning noncanonical NTP pyrophosphatase (MazG superfamily)
MTRVTHHKLIRDLVPQKIEKTGAAYHVRVLDDVAYTQALFEKIKEEAGELARAESREEFLNEYADLMIVLDASAAVYELSKADIALALKENLERKGGFEKRLFLEWTEEQKNN